MRAREFIIEDQPDNPDSWQSQAADQRRDAETVRMADQDAEAGGLAEEAVDEDLNRRGFLKGAGAAAVAVPTAFKAMAQDYSMSDKEINLLAMIFDAYWVCLNYPNSTDPGKCKRIQQGISEYAKKRGFSSQELNGFYSSATSRINEKLKDPRWVDIINQSYTRAETLLKLLNQERPFESVEQGVAESGLNEKSTSQAQFRTMAAAAHNPKFAKKVGISQSVAREFHGADRKQNYKSLPRKAAEDASWGMAPESRGHKK